MYEHYTMFSTALPSDMQLDTVNSDGWELITIVPVPESQGQAKGYFIFTRRPKKVQ